MELIVFLIIFFIVGCFAVVLLFGAPYLPTTKRQIESGLDLLDLKPNQVLFDLGSGDGRILRAAARRGWRAVGFEINPWLVWQSRRYLRQAGLADRAEIRWANFWRQDLSSFDVICFFQIAHVMPRLEAKLQAELRPGSRVVSHFYQFPSWPVARIINKVRLYIKS